MNTSQDEARSARIQKYKEERRKQLTARTATLFSANVTERRPRKASDRSISEDTGAHLKSSSELNLNTVSTSVPIRTTRTSRLRAAATSSSESPTARKSNRSSSVICLVNDAKTKTLRNSKIIDRDKSHTSTNKKQNQEEKENLKTASTTCFNDSGAIRSKPKHSNNKNNLERDRSKNIDSSFKVNAKRDSHNSMAEERKNNLKLESSPKADVYFGHSKIQQGEILKINGEQVNYVKGVAQKELSNNSIKNNDKLATSKCLDVQNEIKLKINDGIRDIDESHSNVEIDKLGFNYMKATEDTRHVKYDSHKYPNAECRDFMANYNNKVTNFKTENEICDSVVSVTTKESEIGSILGAVCVRKVERFSELLSNLCSPCEADLLFEDIFAENGLDGGDKLRTMSPAVAPPCRRMQPTSHNTSTPKRPHQIPTASPVTLDVTGTVTKVRSRRPFEPPLSKTENSLLSSKISTGTSLVSHKPNHNNTSSTHNRSYERRKSSETPHKPSCIPLSKRSADKDARNSFSPNKQGYLKQDSSRKSAINSPANKSKSDSESGRNDRRHRAQKDSESLSEKYHYSKKRLTSLGNTYPKDASEVRKSSPKELLNDNLVTDCCQAGVTIDLESSKILKNMSMLHETVRPHPGGSRLSQEMDSLAALTKETLDRVNKLSNNLGSNKLNLETSEPCFDTLFASTEQKDGSQDYNFGLMSERQLQTRGVSERLKDIDTAAQRLIDFEKQSAMFSDLNHDISSQNRRHDIVSASFSHTPVSILKRKSIHEDNAISNTSNNTIASPPVTFSPSVIEPRNTRCDRQRQGILKKRRSLDESQVARRRSCSPEVSFADDGTNDTSKPILKNRRSSLEDVVRNRSPDGHIQGILKRKLSREEDHTEEDISYGSPEPHGILKRKSNSSSSSSTTSSHVSIAQAVLLAAAGGAEIIDDDKEAVRPILKKKSFSEERPCPDVIPTDTPKPILKKKSTEHDDHDLDRPKKPILKTSKKLSGDDGHASSFDLSEDDRSSRRPSLLRSRTSDHSGSECETTVRPILKQRGSSLTRERSQSPRPRLSFCADNDTNVSVTNFSTDANDLSAAGPSRLLNIAPDPEANSSSIFPSAVLRRRDLRPKSNARSKSLASDVNDELLSILNSRRLKVDENCENGHCEPWERKNLEGINVDNVSKGFPSIAALIQNMEHALTKDSAPVKDALPRSKTRDRDRYKTQPITVEEMRSVTSSLEPGQTNFQAFGPVGVGSFPTRPVEFSAAPPRRDPTFVGEPEEDPFADFNKTLDTPPFGIASFIANEIPASGTSYLGNITSKDDSYGEATFLDFENGGAIVRRQSTLEEIEKEVDKVRVALDEDCRALDEDEKQQAEADNWSLNVSCDSGVYNRASSRDSGPHSGEELGLIESQDIKENHITNSINSNDWSPTTVQQDLITMDRRRRSTEVEGITEMGDHGSDDDGKADDENTGFASGLMKSNSVVARASMWQQLQQQAKGVPRPLIRHSRSKNKDGPPITERFKTQPITWNESGQSPKEDNISLDQSKSSANVLDRDEDAKLDEDDPAKMSLMEKMKMFNKLTHKPPLAVVPNTRKERASRASRLKTMPVLGSQVQEALEQNERLSKSMNNEELPINNDFQRKMELFRSASAKNTSLEYIMKQNAINKSLDLEEEKPPERAQRMITPEVRGILKAGTTAVPKPKTLAKGESSEGLKDEGIDSSSDDESPSASSVSSSENSCSSSDSFDGLTGPKTKRFQTKNFLKNNKLKSSRTDSDLTKLQDAYPRKIPLPCANELKERLSQVKRESPGANNIPVLGKLRKEAPKEEDDTKNPRYRRFAKKLEEPVQLGKLRRPIEKVPSIDIQDKKPASVLKISALNQEAKNKFFGLDSAKKEKSIEELTAAVRKYIQPMSKSVLEVGGGGGCGGSGSEGESSGGREVRYINTRGRQRGGGGIQRSATNADMPQRGVTIAERIGALQEAGANNWRTRRRLTPDREEMKAIELTKNRINESLNAAVEEKKKVQIDKTELGANILADTRNKLETASQQWRTRVPQNDANHFTVAGRLERDKVTATPPLTPPPAATPVTASPGIPAPNKFRSRKQPSPTNGFPSGPLRSASCAVVNAAAAAAEAKAVAKHDRESFKRSHSVSESIGRLDEEDDKSGGAEKTGCSVPVPRADDETFRAFFTPVLEQQDRTTEPGLDVDLDAIDSGSRQLLSHDWARRAKRERRHAASRNPLRALAARTDLREEYSPPPPTGVRERLARDKLVGNCGLAAEALAALASKEDFANVSLRSAAISSASGQGTRTHMLLHVKGRRRVQTRLVEPVHTNVNRGDCFILLTPDHIFLYIGFYCNVIERNRSTDIALHIQNTKDLGCKNSLAVITIDEQNKNYTNKHWNQFWSILGVTDIDTYRPIEAGHQDEDEIYESCMVQTNMYYEVIDDELIPIKEYWGQAPRIAMLQQSKVIVFDFGSEMYIWYGKNVILESRRRAAQLAQELFDEGYNYEECHINPVSAASYQGAREQPPSPTKSAKTRPEWAILSKVSQHMETILLREKFLDWPDYTRVIKVKEQENKTNTAEIVPCDAEAMWTNEYREPDIVLEGSHIGRGTHYYDKESMRHYDIRTKSLRKWIIREYDYQLVENEAEIGEMFSGDSYIIRWEYQITVTGRELNGKPSKHNVTGRDRCTYFCWQGRDATSNEKGAAALLTVELDKEKGSQCRVAQGSEPAAFLNVFQGNLIIHQGKRGADNSRYKLFITRGNVTNEAYLLQVPCTIRQLRSRGSLLLIDTINNSLYIWHGVRSLKHTQNIAIELANKLIARKSNYLFTKEVKITEVKEGSEPKEVLEALGGANKQLYRSLLNGGTECGSDVTPRLFHFTDLTGQFEGHEVLSPLRHDHLVTPFPFEQKELYSASQPALFMLDSGTDVWLWVGWWPRNDDGELEPPERSAGVGAFASRWQAMRVAALSTCESYWRVSRGETRPSVRVVAAGLEPRAFTDLFDTWQERDDAAEANIAHGYKAGDVLSGCSELSRLTCCTAILPLAALQRRPLPDHVDPHHLERHLNTPDFLEAFGMSKEDFTGLPAWKQTNLKKDIGLF